MAGTSVRLVGVKTGRGQFVLDLVNVARMCVIILERQWITIQQLLIILQCPTSIVLKITES